MSQKADEVDVNEPALPRRRKVPSRLEVGEGQGYHTSTPKQFYCTQYFEAFDLIVACVKDCFDQSGYRIYCKLEQLLLNAASGKVYDSEFEAVMETYGSDFNPPLLKTQLHLLHVQLSQSVLEKITISAVKDYILGLGENCSLLSEVVTLVRLILVMPATNATSERSFSALRRVNTYLRTTMNQACLNHLMLLHVHRDTTDKLDLKACANDFVAGNEYRLSIFGTFA